MRAVLISINPPHTNNIFDEVKGIEWRTKPLPTAKHYCYETKKGGGTGKVIGQFVISCIQRFTAVDRIPEILITIGCVSREFLETYSKGRPLYAHWIEEPIRYNKPMELSVFRKPCKNDLYCEECAMYSEFEEKCYNKALQITRPPQSWCYAENEVDTE